MPPESLPTHEDRKRVEHMLLSARDAVFIVGGRSPDEIARDMIRVRALVNCFTEIGEAANRLTPAGRNMVPHVPWRQVVGMRNIIVHVYWGIDVGELLRTVEVDLPGFIAALEAALATWPQRP